MREIVIDSETTGRTFHPTDAVAVHGLTAEFLADKPPLPTSS
jgi:aminoglycoside N3'-acetyltransferase